jgi:LPXTG-motif cell wall-anchored protein
MVNGVKTEISEIEADGRTQFVWTGLDDGDYILEESTVPAGYNKMTDLEFTVTANHTLTDITGLAADGMTADAATGTINDVVVNNTGTVLPETGGMGTMWLIFGGAMLVILAGVVMITRKKMSVYED